MRRKWVSGSVGQGSCLKTEFSGEPVVALSKEAHGLWARQPSLFLDQGGSDQLPALRDLAAVPGRSELDFWVGVRGVHFRVNTPTVGGAGRFGLWVFRASYRFGRRRTSQAAGAINARMLAGTRINNQCPRRAFPN